MKCDELDGTMKQISVESRWYEAEDLPGLSSVDRCLRRFEMRHFLLDGASLGNTTREPHQKCTCRHV